MECRNFDNGDLGDLYRSENCILSCGWGGRAAAVLALALALALLRFEVVDVDVASRGWPAVASRGDGSLIYEGGAMPASRWWLVVVEMEEATVVRALVLPVLAGHSSRSGCEMV